MKIERILNRNRRDFTAVYKCEYCGFTKTEYGYDDTHFHVNVIPNMIYEKCNKAGIDFKYLVKTQPKNADNVII